MERFVTAKYCPPKYFQIKRQLSYWQLHCQHPWHSRRTCCPPEPCYQGFHTHSWIWLIMGLLTEQCYRCVHHTSRYPCTYMIECTCCNAHLSTLVHKWSAVTYNTTIVNNWQSNRHFSAALDYIPIHLRWYWPSKHLYFYVKDYIKSKCKGIAWLYE